MEGVLKSCPVGYAHCELLSDSMGSAFDFVFLDANPAICNLLGIPFDSIANQTALQVIPEILKNQPEWLIRFSEVCSTRQAQSFEYRCKVQNRWYQVQVYTENPGHFSMLFMDITEQKNRFAELEAFFPVHLDLICVASLDGRFIKLNPEWEKVLGYPVEEMIGQPYISFVHPDDVNSTAGATQKIVDGIAVHNFVNRYRHKNGTYRFIEWKGHNFGGYNYASARDITERKNAEEKLLTFIQVSPTAISMVDKDMRYIAVSDQWLSDYGLNGQNVIGRSHYEVFPEIGEDWKEIHRRCIEQGQSHSRSEDSFVRKDGTIQWLRWIVKPWYSSTGSIGGMVMMTEDISEAKAVAAVLKAARKSAEAASRAKSEFLANMSHEIRTPLAGVIGFTELLLNSSLTPVQREYALYSKRAGEALLGIVNDILDFSKIEAGRMDLDLSETSVTDLLDHVLDIVRHMAHSKGLELLLGMQPDMPLLAEFDAVRIKQVLVNLLTNAIKFTECGEVELRVDYTALGNHQGRFHFSVRDTGIGISDEQQAKLFHAFSQADGSITRKYGGTGLGLVISRLLVEKMGGRIQVESIVSKGSTFSFSVDTKVLEFQGDQEKIRGGYRFLLVDDNQKSLNNIEENLLGWGMVVRSCTDAVAALECLKKERFDFVLVDYQMPVADGLDLIQKIRDSRNFSTGSETIVLLHNFTQEEHLLQKLEALNVVLLEKPIKFHKLRNLIQNVSQIVVPEKNSLPNQMSADVFQVLVVEDVPMNMLIIREFVHEMLPDSQCIEVPNGSKALEVVKNQRVDLILMDIQMPEMDGIEATIKIREWERNLGSTARIPIIALTACVTKEDHQRAINCGMDHVLRKPIETTKLRELLQKYSR